MLQITVIAIGLVSVPLTIRYLGTERYGVWLTLSSLLTWLAVSDLGFGGNALINAMAAATGLDDRQWQKELTATAFWSLAGIAACVGGLVLSLPSFVSWGALFNVSSAVAATELDSAITIAIACFLLEFPARVATGVYHGHQEGYVSNFWSILGSFLSLGALIYVSRRSGGLPQLVFALWGTRLFVSALAAVYLFTWRRPWLAPSPRAVTARAFSRLGSLGLRYLVAQAGGMGIFQSQPFIITQLASPHEVAIFGITQRIALLPQSFVAMFLTPLTPAYAEARARKDWEWIFRTYRHSAAVTAVACFGAGILVFVCTRPLIRLWVGPGLEPPGSLVLAFGAFAFVGGLISPASAMLYGIERVGRQAKIALAHGAVMVALGLLGMRYWGLPGMGAAMVIAASVTQLPGQFLEMRAAFKENGRLGSK